MSQYSNEFYNTVVRIAANYPQNPTGLVNAACEAMRLLRINYRENNHASKFKFQNCGIISEVHYQVYFDILNFVSLKYPKTVKGFFDAVNEVMNILKISEDQALQDMRLIF